MADNRHESPATWPRARHGSDTLATHAERLQLGQQPNDSRNRSDLGDGPQLGISAKAKQTLTSLRAAFIVPAAAANPTDKFLPPKMRDAMRPKAHPLISKSLVRSYKLRDGWLEPTLPKGARAGVLKPSKVRLGRVASQVARVQDEHSGAWISVRWAQAKESTGEVADGYVVYDGALGAGSTALTRTDVRGAEQYVRVPSGGPKELRYTIELGDKIAGLRQVRGTDVLEFVVG